MIAPSLEADSRLALRLPSRLSPAPALSEWRDRSPRHGGGNFVRDRRYRSGGEWRYGWGGPQFYRGRWNGGGFGPCCTNTPIGPMWNGGEEEGGWLGEEVACPAAVTVTRGQCSYE